MFPTLIPEGRSVHQRVVARSVNCYRLAAVQADASRSFLTEHAEYANDPVGFCEDVLGNRYTEEIKAGMVSVLENPVTIMQSANAVGKTKFAADIALWWYKTRQEAQVYTIAAPPIDNLQLLLWGEIGTTIENKPELFARDAVRTASLEIKRASKQFITGLAIPQAADKNKLKARFSGKHAPYILFIVDEGDAVPAEIYEAIETCMSGGFARLLILFNPRAESGPVNNKQKRNQGVTITIPATTHPNVVTGREIIPGAVTREATVRRINEWSRPLVRGEQVDGETFEVPAYLVGTVAMSLEGKPFPPLPAGHRRIVEPSLSYMVLARYPAQSENQLISREWVDAAIMRWQTYVAKYGEKPPALVRPVMSHDVADEGKDSNCLTLRYGSWVAPQILWAGVDPDLSAEEAIKVFKANNARYSNVDSTGVGAGVAPKMRRAQCKAYRIMVAAKATERVEEGEFVSVRDQMLWFLREWLRTDKAAAIPPDPDLYDELLVPTYSKNPRNAKIKVCETLTMKEKLPNHRSPDRLMSLALSFAPKPKKDAGNATMVSNYMGYPNG